VLAALRARLKGWRPAGEFTLGRWSLPANRVVVVGREHVQHAGPDHHRTAQQGDPVLVRGDAAARDAVPKDEAAAKN
jgi:uncharacterized protein with PhoU and TrkA domain